MVLRKFFAALICATLLNEAASRLLLPDALEAVEREDWFAGHPYLWLRYPSARKAGTEINRYGFRGADFRVQKPAGVRRVVVVGSSAAYSSEVPVDRSMPVSLGLELERRLPGRKIETINAGVHGYTSVNTLVHVATRVLELGPDVVVFYVGDNDIFRCVLDGVRADLEDRSVDWARTERYERSFRDTTPIARWLGRRSAILGRAVTASGLVRPTTLECVFETAPVDPLAELLVGDGPYSLSAAIRGLRRFENVPERALGPTETLAPKHLLAFHRRNVTRTVELVRASGGRAVICSLVFEDSPRAQRMFGQPGWVGWARTRELIAAANESLLGIAAATSSIHVDLSRSIRPTGEHFADPNHWNEAGCAAVASAVADALVGAGWPERDDAK